MQKIITVIVSTIISTCVCTSSVNAHHAVNAQFDTDTVLFIEGQLVKAELINPHTYIHMDVTDENGTVTRWSFEWAARGVIMKAGIPARELFQIGKTYKVKMRPSRNPEDHTGLLSQLTLPDGRTIGFAAPPN